jgi:hypothetical protein
MAKANRNSKIYAEASAVGVARTLAGLPLEHPFDSIKSRLQTEMHRKVSFVQMTKEIYSTYGFRNGFYAGFLPSAARGIIKQVYRWPLMLWLPQVYSKIYPDSLKTKYPSIAKLSTGFTLAAIDTFIICPLERLKVCLQTKNCDLGVGKFFMENQKETAKSLFRGLESLFYRQMFSWVSFLYADFKFKRMAREWNGLSPTDSLDSTSLFTVSLLVGFSNVMVVMPLDTIKTLYQQHSGEFAQSKIRETVRVIRERGGLKAFYHGWQPRLIQFLIQAVFTVTALERLEEKLRDQNK